MLTLGGADCVSEYQCGVSSAQILEILGITPPNGWPLDGASLLPLIKGEVTERQKPMGWVWGMVYGNSNRTGVCGTWEAERRYGAVLSPETPTQHPSLDGRLCVLVF